MTTPKRISSLPVTPDSPTADGVDSLPLPPVITIVGATLPDHPYSLIEDAKAFIQASPEDYTPPKEIDSNPSAPSSHSSKSKSRVRVQIQATPQTIPTPLSPSTSTHNIQIPPMTPLPIKGPDTPHSLETPLCAHLALLHPQTPPEIINFIAIRLLSRDVPHGYTGPWDPIWKDCGDLLTAGIGYDAAKGCPRRSDSEGQKVDGKIEEMYRVARGSWRVLEAQSPAGSKI